MKNRLLIVFFVAPLCIFSFVRATQQKSASTDLVWLTNIEEAQKLSEKTNKPILANFTGSDWCGWCVKLSKEVFNQPEFKVWADENVILLELDYPRSKVQTEALKQQNASLQQAFQVQSFPTIWVFNITVEKNTKKFNIVPLGKTGYVSGGPTVFTEGVEKMFANAKLQKAKP